MNSVRIKQGPALSPSNKGRGATDRLRDFLQLLDPDLVTGAADDDPRGIGTHSQVDAQFGYVSPGPSFEVFR